MSGKFIAGAIKRPGQLHRDLGVPQGQKIPRERIEAAAQGSGKTAQRARFAETLEKMRGGYANGGKIHSCTVNGKKTY